MTRGRLKDADFALVTDRERDYLICSDVIPIKCDIPASATGNNQLPEPALDRSSDHRVLCEHSDATS